MPPKPFHLPDIASKTGDREREVRGLKRAVESHTKDLRWARIGRDNQRGLKLLAHGTENYTHR